MKARFASFAAALLAAACTATAQSTPGWDEGNVNPADPYMAPLDASTGLGYDEGLGVDPIYTTPSIYEDTRHEYPRFVPNDIYVEYFGHMTYNGGGGHLHVTNAVLTLPFVNPRKAAWAGWHLDVKGTARATFFDCKGANLIDEENLYTLGLHASVSRQLGQRSQLQIGFTPQYSSDFDVMSHHNFFWGGYVAFSSKAGENLRYTLGLAVIPDYYRNLVMPLVSLQWHFAPAWELRVEGARLSCMNVASSRFQWGPFFQWNNAVWTVHRERQTQQLRMNNCIAGMGATYDCKLASGTTLGFLGDLGCAFNNEFRVRDAGGEHTLEKYRSHPGLYARFGCRISF